MDPTFPEAQMFRDPPNPSTEARTMEEPNVSNMTRLIFSSSEELFDQSNVNIILIILQHAMAHCLTVGRAAAPGPLKFTQQREAETLHQESHLRRRVTIWRMSRTKTNQFSDKEMRKLGETWSVNWMHSKGVTLSA